MSAEAAGVLEGLLGSLRALVGPDHVLTDGPSTAAFTHDWTGRVGGWTRAVVRPGSAAEVGAVLRACGAAGVPVVPQGGNTGLVAGGIPASGEIVLSLRRLRAITDADPTTGQLTAGAGATIEEVQAAAAAIGWAYGVDFPARASATVGGSIATNAGGNRVMRYGATREQVLGVEAVLADGSMISHLGGLVKDNTGYGLAPLLCGSEGTLAVVTAARLRLVPALPERVTALLGLASVEDALRVVSFLRRRLASLESAELCLAPGMALVAGIIGAPLPTRAPVVLLVECADQRDPTDDLGAAVEALEGHDHGAGIGAVADVLVATEASRRAELWRWRERHTECIATRGPVHKLDVTLPGPELADFVAEVPGLVRSLAAGAETWIFGHVGDGNLHVNVTGIPPDDERVDTAVLELVARRGGSISAEHGIGAAKKQFLHLSRSPAEIAAMRAIKAALDPAGLLNPGVLFP